MRKETVSVNRPWGPESKAETTERLGRLLNALESQAAFQFKEKLDGVLWNTVTFDNEVEYVDEMVIGLQNTIPTHWRTMTATVEVVVR